MEEVVSIEGTLLMLDDATPHVAVPVQALVAQASLPVQVAATTLSDEGGKYQFVNLKPGKYQLRCQIMGGYVYYRVTDHALGFAHYVLTCHDVNRLN